MDSRTPTVLVDTRDIDEATGRVGSVYCPHEMRVQQRHRQFHALQTEVVVGDLAIDSLQYGADVRIEATPVVRWVLVTTPIRGHLTISSGAGAGAGTRILGPGDSAAIDAHRLFTLQWENDCRLRTLRIPLARVEEAAAVAHSAGPGPVRFGLGGPRSSSDSQGWQALIEMAEREARRAGPIMGSTLLSGQLAQLISSTLVATHPLIVDGCVRVEPLMPRQLRAAIEFMQRCPDQDLTVSDIAAVSGAGVRALQEGFRKDLGTTPMAFLRSIRLERAHDQLHRASPGDGTTVASVAHTWGFGNLGRFSRVYSERYGRLPSRTLRL